MAKVCIVIVNYNGAKFQNDCLRTLFKMENQDFEIVIVDSGSTDNSVKMAKDQFENITVLEQGDNVGVAKGNNIGIQYGISRGAEYTLLLNNDTEVDPKMLDELLKHADERTIVVPKIYYYDPSDVLWYGGGDFVFEKGTVNHVGCDEKVFMYCDDTDFCVRLYDKGYKILYVPNSIVWHKVSSSSGGNKSKLGIYYMNRNQLYFMKKHKKHIKAKTYYTILFKNIAKGVLSPFRKNRNEKYILTAYKDFYLNRMGRRDF